MVFLHSVRSAIQKHRLICKGERILIGVSGGPDSLALLYALYQLRDELRVSLHVAHLNHKLRKTATADCIRVKEISQKLGIAFTAAECCVRASGMGGSLEERGRNARFTFFLKLAKKVGANKIALGHNLDDQAETVLMRILRGSGLYGLSAILPKRKISDLWVIRPLIEIPREEIERFLRQKRVRPCRDETNLQEIYLRNKLRHSLIPLLAREYNPKIKEALSSLAHTSASDYEYLLSNASLVNKRLGKTLSTKTLQTLHPALQRMIIRIRISQLQGDTRRISASHIHEIENLINKHPVQSIVDLPAGISVVKKKHSITFYKK